MPLHQPRPSSNRKMVDRSRPEVERLERGRPCWETHQLTGDGCAWCRQPIPDLVAERCAWRIQELVWQRGRYKHSRATASNQVAFGGQLLKRGKHCIARNAQISLQRPRGGKARAAAELPLQYAIPNRLVKLAVKRECTAGLEGREPRSGTCGSPQSGPCDGITRQSLLS